MPGSEFAAVSDGEHFVVVAITQGLAQRRTEHVVVVDLHSGRRRTLHEVQDPNFVRLGEVRGGLLVLTEGIVTDSQRIPARVTWRVIAVDLVTSKSRVLDEIPGELAVAPHEWEFSPAPKTNGSAVVWLRAPIERREADGIVLLSGGSARVIYRPRGITGYALDDAGRVLIAQLPGSPSDRGELLLWDKGSLGSLGTRPAEDSGFATFAGSRAVWAVGPGFFRAVVRVEVLDLATGGSRMIDTPCHFIGATRTHAVFDCRGQTRLEPLASGSTLSAPGDALRASERAIIRRQRDLPGVWFVTTVDR